MRKANRNTSLCLIERRLSETHIHPRQRQRALEMMREAESVADAIIWVKEKIAALGGLFLKPSLKN